MKLAEMKPERPTTTKLSALAKAMTDEAAETPVKISVRVPPNFRRVFRRLAVDLDCEMQDMVIEALREKYPELRDCEGEPKPALS